jgi:hypothetical protein
MIKMKLVDQRSKKFQEIQGLKISVGSLKNAQKNVPAWIVNEETKKAVTAIISCVEKHKNDAEFPREEVRMLVNSFREAIEERDPRGTNLLQRKINEVTSFWANKPSDIMIAS